MKFFNVIVKLLNIQYRKNSICEHGTKKYYFFHTGTFQKVDFVFLVGVGGGVPHYTDYNKHVRLGDVVVSHPTLINKKYVYVYCESAKTNENGNYHFETKEYCPPNLGLQEIAVNLKQQVSHLMCTFHIITKCYMLLFTSSRKTK